jgi:hypothetical protein
LGEAWEVPSVSNELTKRDIHLSSQTFRLPNADCQLLVLSVIKTRRFAAGPDCRGMIDECGYHRRSEQEQ